MSKYKKIIEKYLTLYHIPSSKTLLWLRISKKLGKANKRNLLKRRIRESFRNLNKKASCHYYSKNRKNSNIQRN